MEELLINQSVYKRNEMKHFVVHICFLSLCNKAVGNEFFPKKKKLCMSSTEIILRIVLLLNPNKICPGDRRKPFGFWRARFGAPKNLRSLFPSVVTEPNSLALREGLIREGCWGTTNQHQKGNHTVVIVLLFSDVKAVIIFINRQHSS